MFETYCSKSGKVLLLTRRVDFEAKKPLKPDSSLLLISRGGKIGNFFPVIK